MSAGAAAILERAIHHARNGQRNPHTALILAGHGDDDRKAHLHALLAVMNAVGSGTLCGWFESKRPTPEQTVELLEEALFQLQLNG